MSLRLWRCPFLRDTPLKKAQSSHPTPVPKAHDPVARCGHPLKILTLMMMTANTQAAFSFDMALHTHSTLEHRTLAHF